MPLRAIGILRSEHQGIEKALLELEGLIDDFLVCRDLGDASQEGFKRLAGFLARDFLLHLKKEKLGLLPVLETRFADQPGSLTTFVDVHDEITRSYFGLLEGVLELGQGAATTSPAAVRIRDCGRSFIEELRDHMRKEEHGLFPFAETHLSENDDDQIIEKFREISADLQAFEHPHPGS